MANLNDKIVERVVHRAEEKNLSPRKVSLLSGHGPDLIRDWKRDKAPLPRLDSVQKVADVLGVRAGWLAFGEDGEAPENVGRSVPVISWVAASRHADPGYVDERSDAQQLFIDQPVSERAFALKVVGDSMNYIAPEGSLIIVDPAERDLIPRKFYVFADEEGATFKRYMRDPDRLEPFSSNPVHEALAITPTTRVIGRAVRVVVDL